MSKYLWIMAMVILVAFTGCGGWQSSLRPAMLPVSAVPVEPVLAAEAGTISVTGEAEVRVVPDEVVLTLGVETSDLDLVTAQRKNNEIVQRVIAVAREQAVEEKYIQTDYLSIEPRYDSNYKEVTLIGYFARKTIVITLRDLSRFESLLSGALQAGANYVQGIEFRTTELRKYRDQARALAIRAAREKAQALAAELGQSLGNPRLIQEERNWWWSGYSSWWGGRWGSGMMQNVSQNAPGAAAPLEGTLAPGMISIDASVTVTFELK